MRQLHELEREAESDRTVYETFLNRSKETQEQIDLPSSTARVISEAYPASKPGSPQVPLLLAGGLCAGLFLGILFALLASVFGAKNSRHRQASQMAIMDEDRMRGRFGDEGIPAQSAEASTGRDRPRRSSLLSL